MEDEFCKDEARVISYFLKLNGVFPSYYLKALCNVLENDENKVKEYVTKNWLNSSTKLINSLTCLKTSVLVTKESPLEACIRRNIAQSLSPSSPLNKAETSYLEEEYCKEEAKIVMYFLKVNGKFPSYYVEALCNVFVQEEEKVKEYVMKNWLDLSTELINTLSCASQ
ncbi:unnamed protein product [Cochlearia groenlandica]